MKQDRPGAFRRIFSWLFGQARKASGNGTGGKAFGRGEPVPAPGEDPEELARRRIKERMEAIESRIAGTLYPKHNAAVLDLSDLPEPGARPGAALKTGRAGARRSGALDDAPLDDACPGDGPWPDAARAGDADGLIFLGPEEESRPGGVDAALARFSRMGLEHPVAAALFRMSMRQQAENTLGRERPDFDKALEFLVSDATFAPKAGPAPEPGELLRADLRLASMPDVYARLNLALREQNCKIEDVAALIGMDPGLSATLLKMVNSAFYGRTMRQAGGRFPVKVDSLSRAVTVIGENQLSNLALAVSVLPLFQNMPREVADVRSFWRHSLGAAIFARALARRAGLDDPERFFLAGLLHDIGRLAAYRRIPSHCLNALALSVGEKISLTEAERRVLGWDHAELGGMLLAKWRYPDVLVRAVAGHHDHEAVSREYETAVTHLADILAISLDYGHSGDRFAPPAAPGAWEILGMTPEGLDAVAVQAETEFRAVFQSMSPGNA